MQIIQTIGVIKWTLTPVTENKKKIKICFSSSLTKNTLVKG